MAVAASHSVTKVLMQAKGGDEQAAYAIWERYFRRLVRFAETRIPSGAGRVCDAEDVASTALDALLRGARDGRFRQLNDRDDLWQLLVMITVRRARNVVRGHRRGPKGESQLVAEAVSEQHGMVAVLDAEPTTESLTALRETCHQLMGRLDPQMRAIVRYRLAGYTHAEIASRMGVVTRTVERKMMLIRKAWMCVSETET